MDREDFEWGIKGPALPLFILSIVIFLAYSVLLVEEKRLRYWGPGPDTAAVGPGKKKYGVGPPPLKKSPNRGPDSLTGARIP